MELEVYAIAFSTDSKTLISGNKDKIINILATTIVI
ncbi:MAG: WD40 repeat domain-containing protein [Nostoc sp.]